MIQDIFPHKLNNQFQKEAKPQPEDSVFVFYGTKILIKKINNNLEKKEIIFPKIKEINKNINFIFLFQLDQDSFYLLDGFSDKDLSTEKKESDDQSKVIEKVLLKEFASDFEFMEIREIRNRSMQPKEKIFASMTAKHLMDWYRDTQFCGRCGQKMTHSSKERAMTCPCCGYTAYPRIMPAVIVGVTNGDKLLLTKYRTGYQHNALVAGFTEIGETLEETVAREVMEETGLHVKNIRYYKSQPWGLPNDILVGFYCDVDGDITITMDESELKYAEWVSRENIELQPDDFSLTNEMMYMFQQGKENCYAAEK